MSEASWYDTGFEGTEREANRSRMVYGPRRLWIPAGASKEIVMVDDSPFCIYEHNPKIGGKWQNWFTCLKGVYDDVACCDVLGDSSYRYYVGYFTVVDCSEWTDRNGVKHQYEVKLLPAKMKTLKKFKRKKEDKGSLVGAMFTAFREDSRSPSVGDEFEFKREVDLNKLFEVAVYSNKKLKEVFALAEKENRIDELAQTFQVTREAEGVAKTLVPFNYFELLKPMPPADVKRFLLGVDDPDASAGGGDDSGPDEDDVPF